jgi:hypothetical protein
MTGCDVHLGKYSVMTVVVSLHSAECFHHLKMARVARVISIIILIDTVETLDKKLIAKGGVAYFQESMVELNYCYHLLWRGQAEVWG